MVNVYIFCLLASFGIGEEFATKRIESSFSANDAMMVMASTREWKEMGLDRQKHEEAKRFVVEMLSKVNSLTHKAMLLQNEKSKDEFSLRSKLLKIDQEIADVQKFTNTNAKTLVSGLNEKQKRMLTAILVLRQREFAVLNQYVAAQIDLSESDRLKLIADVENSLRDFTIMCKSKLDDCKDNERSELSKKFLSEWNGIGRRTVRDFLSSAQCASYDILSTEADSILAARSSSTVLPK